MLKKQPDRPSREGNSGLPWLVRRIARGRGRSSAIKIHKISIGAVRASARIVPKNVVTDGLETRVLGKHSSEQGDAPDKNFLGGVEMGLSTKLKAMGLEVACEYGPTALAMAVYSLPMAPMA